MAFAASVPLPNCRYSYGIPHAPPTPRNYAIRRPINPKSPSQSIPFIHAITPYPVHPVHRCQTAARRTLRNTRRRVARIIDSVNRAIAAAPVLPRSPPKSPTSSPSKILNPPSRQPSGGGRVSGPAVYPTGAGGCGPAWGGVGCLPALWPGPASRWSEFGRYFCLCAGGDLPHPAAVQGRRFCVDRFDAGGNLIGNP